MKEVHNILIVKKVHVMCSYLNWSQSKMMSMVEKLTGRVDILEKSKNETSSTSGSNTSPGEQKRIPNNISVS